jgi:hypothetical protein
MMDGIIFSSRSKVQGSGFVIRGVGFFSWWFQIERTVLLKILGCVTVCPLRWCAEWARRRAVLGDRHAPWAVAYKSVFSRSLTFEGGGSAGRKVRSTCTNHSLPHSWINANPISPAILESLTSPALLNR